MNYAKNLNLDAMMKRIVATWCVIAVICTMVGGVAGYALSGHINAYDSETEVVEPIGQPTTEEVLAEPFTPIDCGLGTEEQEYLHHLCDGYNIDFALVMALIQKESGYRADVISTTNDYGLMQINEVNHGWLYNSLGVTNFLDPYENMWAGCYMLNRLFEKYEDVQMVLMAYNMGEAGAAKLWNQGIYHTEYSDSILDLQLQIDKQLMGGDQE